MRRLRPPVPDVDRVSVADVLAFVDEWDSSDYLRRDVGVMHAVDFVLFLRFAAADEDARGVTNDLGIAACVPGSTAARLAATAAATVRRQAVDTIASKRAFATRDARRALARREGEALAGCLREELAVYGAQRDPAVGGLERPHAFRVTFEPGRGCVAKLTPEPTLALALAASDDAGAGFVTPAETALALAQCRVPLTAVESAAFGEHLARRPGRGRPGAVASMRSSKRSIASRYRAPSPRRTSPSSSPRGAPARGEPSRPSTSEARRPTPKRARVRRTIPRMIPRRGTGSLVVRWFPLTTWIWSFCGTWRRPRRSRRRRRRWRRRRRRAWPGTARSRVSSPRSTTSSGARGAAGAAAAGA